MKKSLLLIGGLIACATLNAQTYFTDNFEGGSLTGNNAWTQEAVTGTLVDHSWYHDVFSGNNFAEINNFPDESEVWLISPVIDLQGQSATNPYLSFTNTSGNFDGPNLELYVSTAYAGGAISMGDWTELTGWALSPGSGDGYTATFSGDIDLTSYASSSTVYIAFRYTSAASSAQEYQVDDVLIQEGATPPPTFTPIADIQATTSGDASDMNGQTVNVGGRVQAINTGSGFWIQDAEAAWSGIYVFDFGDHTVALGDSVTLTGTIAEYAPGGSVEKATQLATISNFNNVGSFGSYAPIALSTLDVNDEAYESVLVQVTNASCTAPIVDFNEYSVNDGSGDIVIDDFLYLTTPAPAVGDIYDITGVVGHNFGAFKILPRDAADVVQTGFASINEVIASKFNVYPNPSTGEVNFENTLGAEVAIFNSLGQKVATTTSSSITLKSGLYFISVANTTVKVIVK